MWRDGPYVAKKNLTFLFHVFPKKSLIFYAKIWLFWRADLDSCAVSLEYERPPHPGGGVRQAQVEREGAVGGEVDQGEERGGGHHQAQEEDPVERKKKPKNYKITNSSFDEWTCFLIIFSCFWDTSMAFKGQHLNIQKAANE